jgi:hypothetical protein
MTAVEWQHIELMRINFEYATMKLTPREFQEQTKDILDKAKEIEKEQKEEFFKAGKKYAYGYSIAMDWGEDTEELNF